jgi:hypothetical protein
MNNFDDVFVNQAAAKPDNKDFTSFNKEEWTARKQQERADAYALIDETAEKMTGDGATVSDLCWMCRRKIRPLLVGNALLIAAQSGCQRLAIYGSKDDDTYVKKARRHHHSGRRRRVHPRRRLHRRFSTTKRSFDFHRPPCARKPRPPFPTTRACF